jgi:transcriptional regulator with XRE-family HTH domain|nr:MAG TPA: helix-turn-helix XRE-family like protein [Caudoviricetes sp.]
MENKVWYYRNQKNMSLKELSRYTGISVAEINLIENGFTNDILLSNAIRLSKVLRVDLYELFCIKR